MRTFAYRRTHVPTGRVDVLTLTEDRVHALGPGRAVSNDPSDVFDALVAYWDAANPALWRYSRVRRHALDRVSFSGDPDERGEARALCGEWEECSGSGRHGFLSVGHEDVDCPGCVSGAKRLKEEWAAETSYD